MMLKTFNDDSAKDSLSPRKIKERHLVLDTYKDKSLVIRRVNYLKLNFKKLSHLELNLNFIFWIIINKTSSWIKYYVGLKVNAS